MRATVHALEIRAAGQVVFSGANNGYDRLHAGYRITTSRNGGSARYRGIEFAYRQQFTFLPVLWRGFGLNANHTHLTTQGDYGGATATPQVACFAPNTGNVAGTYLGYGFKVRLNAVWRDTGSVANSANAALLVYEQPKLLVT